jgi:hypothetical protein
MNHIYNTSIDGMSYPQGVYGVHDELAYHSKDIDFPDGYEYGDRILVNRINEYGITAPVFRIMSFIGIFIASFASILIIGSILYFIHIINLFGSGNDKVDGLSARPFQQEEYTGEYL